MIPKPQQHYLETEQEFVVAFGKNKLIEFVNSLPRDITMEDSRQHMSGKEKAVYELLTKHDETVAIGDGFIMRNPTDEYKHLPFVMVSMFEAAMWTYISVTWGMDFAHKMLISQHPIEYQRKWATCHWCGREFRELARLENRDYLRDDYDPPTRRFSAPTLTVLGKLIAVTVAVFVLQLLTATNIETPLGIQNIS